MHQTTHFFNLGYGWLCKHCSAENTERKHHDAHSSQRLALAKWIDEEHRGLVCPRCGIEESHQEAQKRTKGIGSY
jgi:DNA-directed RNA polymerase subunit RPC12/RpoP